MFCRLSSIRFGGRLPPCLCVLFLLLSGCDVLLSGDPGENLVALVSGAGGSGGSIDENDLGGDFENAQDVSLPDFGGLTVHGDLTSGTDVDIYRVGPARAGEVFVFEVSNTSADTRAALFDAAYSVIVANDDRNYYAGQRDPRVQTTLRQNHETLYIAVAGKSSTLNLFAPSGGGTAYDLTITRAGGLATPGPKSQKVWIELGGGSGVRIAGEPLQDVAPFDPAAIDPRFAYDREVILEQMLAMLRMDYADYNVDIRSSDRDIRWSEPHSVVYVGGFSSAYLGLADNVDWFNGELVQEAIVYSETLRLFNNLQPSWDQVATALANVTAHELGHLLGLDHTLNQLSVMSEAASAQAVLQLDADLIPAPLNTRVFPIGMQDAPLKLALGVGLSDPFLSLDAFLAAKRVERQRRADEAALTAPEPLHSLLPADAETSEQNDKLHQTQSLKALGLRMCSHAHGG